MKVAINKIKKNENINILIFILVIIIGFCTNIHLSANDEIWNFQNIYKMLSGKKIYTDANVITTPLFHFLGFCFLKLLGENILIFRIYNILIMLIMYFLIYKIIRKFCNNIFAAFIYISIIIIKTKFLCTVGANYNALAMTFVLYGIYTNLKYIDKKYNNNFVQAIIMFLVIFTKQNIGVFYILGLIAYQILTQKRITDILKQILILGILLSISMMLFIIFDIMNDFISYAILGIKEFAKENIGGEINGIVQTIFFIIMAITLTIFLIKFKKIQNEDKTKLIFLVTLSIPLTFIGFPIYNSYHLEIGNIVLYIAIIFLLEYMILKYIEINRLKKILKIIVILIILLYIYISLINFIYWIKYSIKNSYFNTDHPFFGGQLEENNIEEFENITKYILDSDKKVIVLTEDAALYMVPLKISNGAMDMPFLGNFGNNGETKIINEIKNMSNTIILIKKDQSQLFWQESKKINDYIKENLKFNGEIEKFAIYETF